MWTWGRCNQRQQQRIDSREASKKERELGILECMNLSAVQNKKPHQLDAEAAAWESLEN
jgi:ABC-type sulfate/molybdate transport systems ATPase subunit